MKSFSQCYVYLLGRSVHEPGEEGESLLSLACSAGYYELAEVLLRMRAGVEDRGLKGKCTCTHTPQHTLPVFPDPLSHPTQDTYIHLIKRC